MTRRIKRTSGYCENFHFLPHLYKGFSVIMPPGTTHEDMRKKVTGYNVVNKQYAVNHYKDENYKMWVGDLLIWVDLNQDKNEFSVTIGSVYDNTTVNKVFQMSDLSQRSIVWKILSDVNYRWSIVEVPEKDGMRLLHSIDIFEVIEKILGKSEVFFYFHEHLVASEKLSQEISYCV